MISFRDKDKIIISNLLFALKDHGVDTIQISYSGGGDSGAIDEFKFLKRIGAKGYEKPNVPAVICSKAKSILEDYVYDHLETVDNWYNDEGGYGTYTLDLNTLEYDIDNNVNYIKTYQDSGNGYFFE